MLNPRTKNALYVLIFTAIAVLGAYFLIIEINKMSQDSNESILSDFWQKKRPNQAEVADTKNWKIYRNEEYGFEFKYPEFYKLGQQSNSTIHIVQKETQNSSGSYFGDFANGIDFEVIGNAKKVSLDDWVKNQAYLENNKYTIESLKIDNKNAVKVSYSYRFADEQKTGIVIFVSMDDNIYTFSTASQWDFEYLDQILSTFKFISKKTTFTIDDITNKSLKVGDVLGDFTVTSVGVFFKDREDSINEDNYEVIFSGVSIIEAEYEYEPIDPGPGPTLWLIADDNSDIPGLNGTKKIFTLNNYSDVEKYFGETPSRGRVTLKIRDYYAIGCGCEKSDETKLVELISKQVY